MYKAFAPSFKFHSNLSFKKSSLKKLLTFYRHLLNSWSQSFAGSPETSSQILSQFLWFNKYFKIEGTALQYIFQNSLIKILTFYGSYLKMAGSYHGSILKIDMKWQIIGFFFQWAQLKHAIPPRWEKVIFDYSDINENDLCQNHHVIKRARILPLDKLRKCIQF